MFEFPHTPPLGYKYEIEQFRRNVYRICIVNLGQFSYTDEQPKSVWGFYNSKQQVYYAPVNYNKIGDEVDFAKTTPYSAMQILKPLTPSILQFL